MAGFVEDPPQPLPLQSLARQAALVSTQSWKLQPPKEAEEIEELRPLTESMTQMLARLEYSFKQQREFVGNAAHELKTPVAVLKSTLQSLLQRPRSSDEYRAGLQASLQDLDRLEQLLQWMLRLARAEQWAQNSQRRELDVIDINSTCEEAVERIRGLAQSRNTTIHLATNGPVPFRADPEDLQLVWTNLLENAVRYSPEGSSVEVAVLATEDKARIPFRTTASAFPPAICPRFSIASIAETAPGPALPAVSAWAWPSLKPWWKPTGGPSPRRAPRQGHPYDR